MKATIDVSSRQEGDAIRAALADETTRAFVLIMGTLFALPDRETRIRCLRTAADTLGVPFPNNGPVPEES